MHMGRVFALLSAVPGKERELMERLTGFPGVRQKQHLFGEQIALVLEEAQAGAPLAQAQGLAALTGVREARVYHDHEAWVVKPRVGS
jgi:hypothetical protein